MRFDGFDVVASRWVPELSAAKPRWGASSNWSSHLQEQEYIYLCKATKKHSEMLARSCTRCVVRSRSRLTPLRVQRRNYAASAGAAPAPAPSSMGMLAPMVTELDRMAPSFDIRGANIRVIKTPADFYETLKVCSLISLLRARADLSGTDTECERANLPLDVVYRQVGARAHRHPEGSSVS